MEGHVKNLTKWEEYIINTQKEVWTINYIKIQSLLLDTLDKH